MGARACCAPLLDPPLNLLVGPENNKSGVVFSFRPSHWFLPVSTTRHRHCHVDPVTSTIYPHPTPFHEKSPYVALTGRLYVKVWPRHACRYILKALFNNVFTFTNLSCMALHAISFLDKVYKWSPEKIAPRKHHQVLLQRSQNRQVTGFILLISPP